MPGRKEEIKVRLQLPVPELINKGAPDGGAAVASVCRVKTLDQEAVIVAASTMAADDDGRPAVPQNRPCGKAVS